jgi:HlyD family secretion protein
MLAGRETPQHHREPGPHLGRIAAGAVIRRVVDERIRCELGLPGVPVPAIHRARLTHERNTRTLDELTAQLATAGLGARIDAIAAATADAGAASAAKERADWSVAQKNQSAPRAALVYDTLYREGEFIAAGAPVVSLLPPEHLKVRFYVPEAEFAALKAGDPVRIALTGRPPLDASVSYLSPKPEYTPPVLYNRENRAKLVWLVEAVFADPSVTRDLHPGQPVDVQH